MRLRPNGPVPNKRPRLDKSTVSGYPRINTFQGVDYKPCSWDGRGMYVTKDLPGHNHHARHRRGLHRDNLMHRAKPQGDYWAGQVRRHFESARRLSLQVDQHEGAQFTELMKRYDAEILAMRELEADAFIIELTRLEACRGVFRFKATQLDRPNVKPNTYTAPSPLIPR